MDYLKIYRDLISSRKLINKVKLKGMETHHIVPKHAGGDNSKENLVHLTRKEHKVAHHLLYKIYGREGDWLAYRFFLGVDDDLVFQYRSYSGKIGGAKNAETGHIQALGRKYGPEAGRRALESGHLDRIRLLVDKEVQSKAASATGKMLVEDGRWLEIQQKAWDTNRQLVWDKERVARYAEHMNNIRPRGQDMLDNMKKATEVRVALQEQEVMERLANAPRKHLEKKHPAKRSKYLWISHEGLVFNSPQELGYYYGFKAYEVENFCKRNKYGFSRIPKPPTE